MASNSLTKEWIQYLKNNQIVAPQSDPKTGSLNYRRKVTADDVIHFLQVKTDYSDDEINDAIDSLSGEAPSHNVLAIQPPSAEKQTTLPQQKKYDTSSATDIEPRSTTPTTSATPSAAPAQPIRQPRTGGKKPGEISQTPNAIRKRQARANRKASLTEEFVDEPGRELSEKDVEQIFKKLDAIKAAPTRPAIDPQDVRIEEIEKIKHIIRDTMTDQQRMSLWRALQDE